MKRGEWTRWGRGMCEGYSLEIGPLLYGAVVKRETKGLPISWMASVNATALGEYPERSEAMRRVEDWLDANMQIAIGIGSFAKRRGLSGNARTTFVADR